MILYLNKNFGEDLLLEVIDFYNKKPTDIQIYLNCNGGFVNHGISIQHIIENSDIPTTMYAFNHIASCAVDLFFKTRVKEKYILKGCTAMIHQKGIEAHLNEKLKLMYNSDSWVINTMKRHRKETEEFCKALGMTKKELNTVLKGDDLGVSYERLLEMYKHYE